MASNYQSVCIFIISTILGICVYSVLYLLLLGIKLIHYAEEDLDNEKSFVVQVVVGTSLIIIILTAFVFIFLDRPLSGRFFLIATILGIYFIIEATVKEVSISPIKVALGLKRYTWKGLVIGHIIIIFSNILSFFIKIPSML